MAVDVGSAVGYLDLDISGFLAGLKSAQSEADSASRNIAAKIGSNLSGIGNTLTSVGTTLTKKVSVPLLGVGVAGLKVATDFEKGMSEVKAVSGATQEEFDALREKAIELGADTAFSANEVAAAMTEMAKAGWTSQQIIDGMGGVLDATAASGENLASVSTIIADAVTGFGLEAGDSGKIADILTQAANSGTIGINDLGESFKYIAPVAGAMNLSVEDVTTALSVMSKAGIKGSQAGTSLKNTLTNLVNPVGQSAEAIEQLGISAVNSDGSMKSLDEIVSNLRTSFDGLSESEKAQYAAMLAGKEGMPGLLSLLNLTEEEYNAVAQSMDNAGGVAKETAAIMQDNLASKIEQFFGSLESLAIKLADLVLPYLSQFVTWLTTLVDKFTELDPKTQAFILKLAGIAIAAGPVIATVGKIVTAVGSLVTGFGKLSGGFAAVTAGGEAGAGILAKLGGALAGITGPVAAAIAVVAALAAAFITLWKNNEEFRNNFIAIWNEIKATFEALAQGIVDTLNSFGFNFHSITDVLSAVWQGFCDILAPIFLGVFQYISDTFQTITGVILGVLDFFVAVFNGDWEGAWNAVKGIFETVWNGIVAWFQNIGNIFIGICDNILGWVGTSWSEAWNNAKTLFTIVWGMISSTATTAWNGIKSTITNASNTISTKLSSAWTGIKNNISTATSFIGNTISTTFNSAKTGTANTWNNIKATIANSMNSAKTTVSNVVGNIGTTISNKFNAAKTTVTNIFNSIKNTISTTFESAKTIISGAIEKIKGYFNFSWSLPELKMPHVSVTWSSSGWLGSAAEFLGLPGIPNFSVSWYKKAMAKGMILNGATIFGMDKNGNLMGGGEAGSETVVGTNSLLNMIRQTVNETIGPLITISRELAKAFIDLGYVTYDGFAKIKEAKTSGREASKNYEGSGDTFIFNSPKPIDEIEAAKQIKKTKRELAEGF